MTSTEVVKANGSGPALSESLEQVLVQGDLSKLTPADRVSYYKAVCESVGLNPLTKPFEYITLNGKLTLYALKGCTDQLRSIYDISVEDLTESERDSVFVVTAKVKNGKGRTDMAKGAVAIKSLQGEALANALMKAETKAKRRATLSICGLGMLDETEIETIPNATKEEQVATRDAVLARRLEETAQRKEEGTATEEEKFLLNVQQATATQINICLTNLANECSRKGRPTLAAQVLMDKYHVVKSSELSLEQKRELAITIWTKLHETEEPEPVVSEEFPPDALVALWDDMGTIEGRVKVFTDLKQQLFALMGEEKGEAQYRATLGRNGGKEKSNQYRTADDAVKARKAVEELWRLVQQLKESKTSDVPLEAVPV